MEINDLLPYQNTKLFALNKNKKKRKFRSNWGTIFFQKIWKSKATVSDFLVKVIDYVDFFTDLHCKVYP